MVYCLQEINTEDVYIIIIIDLIILWFYIWKDDYWLHDLWAALDQYLEKGKLQGTNFHLPFVFSLSCFLSRSINGIVGKNGKLLGHNISLRYLHYHERYSATWFHSSIRSFISTIIPFFDIFVHNCLLICFRLFPLPKLCDMSCHKRKTKIDAKNLFLIHILARI